VANKIKIFGEFVKFNIVSLLATSVDFAVFIVLNEIFDVYYITATVISAICGGVTAFIFNRNWVFFGRGKIFYRQLSNFILVWGGSIFLNTTGIFMMVQYLKIDEVISKIIVSVLVGVLFNFTMNKYYVFK
jgi:putative flippase GtrA